jgi:signal transduction histidine kinase
LPPGGGRLLEFRFTANTFLAPERARFRYRLHGLSENWVENGTRREVHFADLHPGSYAFEVIACNHHGVWPERGAVLAFQLMPYYYQTWWFYLVSATILGCVIAMGVTWRIRELRKIQELERANALNEQRKRIARDVHDDLGSSLTHILQLSQARGSSTLDSPSADSRARRIASIAEAAVDHMAEIVWANNPEFDTLEDLVAYLREYAANFIAATDLRARFDFPESVPAGAVSGLVRRHVLLILKEALQNVVKHAAARRVRVAVTLEDRHLRMVISDDGRGLPEGGGRRFGNGLVSMRSRVNELGGTFEISSQPENGTELKVRVPTTAEV